MIVATSLGSTPWRISLCLIPVSTIPETLSRHRRNAARTRSRKTSFPSSASMAVFRRGHPPGTTGRRSMKFAMKCLSLSMLLGIRSKSCIRVSKADFHAKSNASTASGGKPLPIDDLVRFAIQITDALDAAHRLGIIHRDIKPSNIFIAARGEAKVLDFGLAKQLGPKTPDPLTTAETAPEPVPVSNITLTLTGVAMGTAGYMSPEQVRGEALDTRTDLFSFGLVLYEMATAKRAFAGETGPSLKDAILQKTPIPTRELAPRLPAKLAMIINKALQKDREARYQSASELRADLEALRQDLAPTRRLRKWAIAAGCAALALAVAMAGLALHRPKRAAGVRLLKQRQLTTNSSENPYRSGTISPDGKYIAYSDPMGVHIKVLATGSLT